MSDRKTSLQWLSEASLASVHLLCYSNWMLPTYCLCEKRGGLVICNNTIKTKLVSYIRKDSNMVQVLVKS